MFVSKIDNNSNNSQSIQLINEINSFNQNAIETNTNINQEIMNTSQKITGLESAIKSLNRQQLIKRTTKQQQQQLNDDITTIADLAEISSNNNNDDDEQQQQQNTSNNDTNDNNGNQQDGDVLQVNCNSVVALLSKKKFGSGGKGKCIYVDNKWLTPIEFENYCGKSNCRDWKRTIKVGGQPLITLLDNNVLMCHAVSCSCAVCSNDANVVGPIRPFLRYRRRKRDEIMAQDAYKKFMRLKPLTLFQQHTATAAVVTNPSMISGGNGVTTDSKLNGSRNNDYSMIEDALSTMSSTSNSDYNNLDIQQHHTHRHHQHNQQHHNKNNNISSSHYPTNSQQQQQQQSQQSHQQQNSFNFNELGLNQSLNNNDNCIINNSSNCGGDRNNAFSLKISNSLKEMQKLEAKQWTMLEKAADILIIQSQNLKNLIQQAKNQNKLTRSYLISQLNETNNRSDENTNDDHDDEDGDNHHHSRSNNNGDGYSDNNEGDGDEDDDDDDEGDDGVDNDHDNNNEYNFNSTNKDNNNIKSSSSSLNRKRFKRTNGNNSRIEINNYDYS